MIFKYATTYKTHSIHVHIIMHAIHNYPTYETTPSKAVYPYLYVLNSI